MKEIRYARILLIDDDKDMRLILKDILKDIGVHEVADAPDVIHAFSLLNYSHNPFDVIFSDWNLPGRSGLELLQEIRKKGSDVPFFMITGRGDTGSVRMAGDAGVTGYIRKPFSPKQIEDRLRATLTPSYVNKHL